MPWYYQLLKTSENMGKLVCAKAHENNLSPTNLDIKGCGNFIAIGLSDLRNMKKFDEAMDKEKIYPDYFLFTNDKFESLIKEAGNNGIEIRNIKISKTGEEINNKINTYLETKKYEELADLINKTDVFVKNIELTTQSVNKQIMTIYDSGVCRTDSKNYKPREAKSLIKCILNVVCGTSTGCNTSDICNTRSACSISDGNFNT